MICEESIVFFVLCFSYVLTSSCKPKCGVPSEWLPIATNVCYGTKNSDYGSFKMNKDCELYAIRLSHVSGFQSAFKQNAIHRSRWGCSRNFPNYFCTLLLREDKPWSPNVVNQNDGSYLLSGFSLNDDVIVLKKNETLAVGTQIHIAFGADVGYNSDDGNEGVHCVDVDMSCFV